MEWPTIEVLTLSDRDRYNFYNDESSSNGDSPFVNSPSSPADREEFLANMTTVLITKEIYARAATASISNITIDHESSGLKNRVKTFLEHLRQENDDHWINEYRSIAREFTELMAEARPRSRTLEICRGGLEAVHDLLRYRLPKEKSESASGDTILAARDAFVLCQSFDKLQTNTVTGVRPPDIDYRFPLLTTITKPKPIANNNPNNSNNNSNSNNNTGTTQTLPTISVDTTNDSHSSSNNNNNNNNNNNQHHAPPAATTMNAAENEGQSLFGFEACRYLAGLREDGRLETSATSLASHTMVNRELVARMAHKTFVIFGCDHPLAPTKSLLTIPGLKVLGIPSCSKGLDDLRIYTTYNAPDDTSFVYPTLPNQHKYDRGGTDNLVLTRGPHVAQWILEHTEDLLDDNKHPESELVLVPMPLPARITSTTTTTAATTTTTTTSTATTTATTTSTTATTPTTQCFSTESSIRWAAASDLILQRVLRARSDDTKCSIWSYQSSTTCMVVPSASTTKSTELLNNRPMHEQLLHRLSMGTVLTPTVDETMMEESPEASPPPPTNNHDYAIVNGIVTAEGPHHVLSEHIRMWRAMVINYPDEYQRYDDDYDDDSDDDEDQHQYKVHVFAPYVPLISPDLVSGGEAHTHLLDPLKVFGASEAASLMAAVSIAGLSDPIVNRPMPLLETVGERYGRPVLDDTTPFAMFWNGSFHGGIWNCPYTLDSANGTVGYVLGKVYEYYHYYYYGSGNASENGNANTAEPSTDNTNTTKKSSPSPGTTTPPPTEADNDNDSDWILDVVPASVGKNRRGLQLQDLQDDPQLKDDDDDDDDDLPDIVQQRLEMMV